MIKKISHINLNIPFLERRGGTESLCWQTMALFRLKTASSIIKRTLSLVVI